MVRRSLTVLYEDQALIVIDKPEGAHTAPLVDGEPDTLQALLLSSFPEISGVPGLKPFEHGLLHRLDRHTSGVVVVARTPAAFAALKTQFSCGQVQKDYVAACVCRPGGTCEDTFTVTSRFAPEGPGRRMVRVVLPDEKNRRVLREATRNEYTTAARVLRRGGDRALVSAIIRKGFRHQVRAHLSFAGWPILGDDVYGTPVASGIQQRMYLHAVAVSLLHPMSGEPLRVVSPMPDAFNAVVSARGP